MLQMRYFRFSVALSLQLLCALSAVALPLKSGFYASGKFRSITIDQDVVAVPVISIKNTSKIHSFGLPALEKLAEVGAGLILKNSIDKSTEIIGYPLWFNQAKKAVGVLTREILVRTDSQVAKSVIRETAGVLNIAETPFRKGLYLVKYSSPLNALTAANKLFHKKGIIYAHPNFLIPKDFRDSPRAIEGHSPTAEPLFSRQWHLENTGQTEGDEGADIKAKLAWSISQGKPEIKIAIVDGGFEHNHEDLIGGWYINPGEIPADGQDNDNNGYIDDVSGWNFRANSPNHRDSIHSHHGTAVAGLVGARANGLGVTGVCPGCTMIPITTSFSPESDAAAIYYAGQLGADIITNSWGYPIGTPNTDAVVEAIKDVIASGRNKRGSIVLFAMNNFDNNDCVGEDADISSIPEVVAISAATDKNEKFWDSGWGPCLKFISPTWMYQHENGGIVTTDLPGESGYNPKRFKHDLLDTNYTQWFNGTSAATPIAAGIFGLLLSVDPSLTKEQALELMKFGADKISAKEANYDPISGLSLHYGYGRVDAGRTLLSALIRKRRLNLMNSGKCPTNSNSQGRFCD